MKNPGFIFGGKTNWSYDQLQRQRQIADAMAGSIGTPRNTGEGLSAIGKALAARGINKRADAREGELREEMNEQLAALMGGMGGSAGGSYGGSSAYAQQPVEKRMGLDMGAPADMLDKQKNPTETVDGTAYDMGREVKPELEQYRNAIASIESDGSGGYSAIGPTHSKLGRALGRYQVMEANLPQWSREALGRSITAEEYLASPKLQDAIFDHKFGGYVDRFGPEGAAQAWFAGPGGVGKMGRKDSLGTSVADYTQKFQGALGGGQGSFTGQSQQTAQAGGIDPSVVQISQLLGNPMLPPGQKAVLGALLDQRIKQSTPLTPLQQQQYDLNQIELERARNPQVDPLDAVRLEQAQLDLEQDRAPQPGYTTLTPDEVESLGLPPGAYQKAGDGKIVKVGGNGVTVNNNMGGEDPGRYIYAEDAGLPKGWRFDKETQQAEVIPGGPAEQEAIAEGATKQVATENKERSGQIVGEDIDRALSIVKRNGQWATGFGAILKGIPGTEAKSLNGLLQTIKANVGFDRLQQMRDASVTGGALGAINKTEMDLLQAVLGNLEQSLDPDDLAYNLRRVNEIYLDIIHGPGNRPDKSSGAESGTAGSSTRKRLKFNPETGALE